MSKPWHNELDELRRQSRRMALPADVNDELRQLFEAQQARWILVTGRSTLEAVLSHVCETFFKRPMGNEPIKGVVDKLKKDLLVEDNVLAAMYTVNQHGTLGAHRKSFDAVQVRTALLSLSIVLSWYADFVIEHGPPKGQVTSPLYLDDDELVPKKETQQINLLERGERLVKSRLNGLLPIALALLIGGALVMGGSWLMRSKQGNVAIQGQDPSVLIKEGYQAFQAGDHSKAIAYYNRCLELDPAYAAAYNNRALVYQELKQWDQALTDSNQAIALDPDYAVAYGTRGWTFYQKGKPIQALEDLDKSMLLKPESRWPWYYRGRIRRDQEKCQEALNDFKKACGFGHQEACQATCP